MKIALLRYNLPIQLRLESGLYVGGCDEVVDFLKALIVGGHEVTIYSDVYKDDYKWWLEKGYKNTPYEFLKDLKIEQGQYIDPEIKHCIIECGTTTLLFVNKEKLPYIMKCSDQICHFEGVVYYWQADGVLPIALHPEKFKFDFIGKFGYILNFRRMIKNKIWVIINRCKDVDFFINKNKGTRFQYAQHKAEGLPIYGEYIPMSYPYWIFKKPFRKPMESPENFLTYTGNSRARLAKFKKYYCEISDKFDITVAGNWKENITSQYPKINWLGKLRQMKMRPLLHNSRCQVLIGDKIYDEYNWVTPRVPECISAGCLVLTDMDNESFIYKHLGFGFKNQEELIALLNKVKKLPYNLILKYVKDQQDFISYYDFNMIIRYMKKVLTRYDEMYSKYRKTNYKYSEKRFSRKEKYV